MNDWLARAKSGRSNLDLIGREHRISAVQWWAAAPAARQRGRLGCVAIVTQCRSLEIADAVRQAFIPLLRLLHLQVPKAFLYVGVSLIINWLTILLPSHHPLPCRTAYAKIPEGACRHRRGLGAISEEGKGRALACWSEEARSRQVCTVVRTVAVSDCDRSLLRIVDGRPDWPRRGDCGDLRLARCGEFGWAVRDQTMQVFSMPSGGNTSGGCGM